MGCSFSSFSWRWRSSSSFKVKNIIRVVHLNGFVQDFENPITVSQLIGPGGGSPKQFLCTPAQLISNCSKGLQHDTILELGHIYFLLPYSTLQPDVSPVDLASLAKKLTEKAKSIKCKANKSGTSPNQLIRQVPDSAGAQRLYRVRAAWKPILETIREKSFNRRSESDLLQET